MIIRPLQEQELSQADHVFRLAFGTAAQLSNPLQMFGDAGYMQRWYLKTGCAIFPTEAKPSLYHTISSNQYSLGNMATCNIFPASIPVEPCTQIRI
jgi:hypothetical protein